MAFMFAYSMREKTHAHRRLQYVYTTLLKINGPFAQGWCATRREEETATRSNWYILYNPGLQELSWRRYTTLGTSGRSTLHFLSFKKKLTAFVGFSRQAVAHQKSYLAERMATKKSSSQPQCQISALLALWLTFNPATTLLLRSPHLQVWPCEGNPNAKAASHRFVFREGYDMMLWLNLTDLFKKKKKKSFIQ
mgnify:CR=1 FL=1